MFEATPAVLEKKVVSLLTLVTPRIIRQANNQGKNQIPDVLRHIRAKAA